MIHNEESVYSKRRRIENGEGKDALQLTQEPNSVGV